jgi:hypothetical protein
MPTAELNRECLCEQFAIGIIWAHQGDTFSCAMLLTNSDQAATLAKSVHQAIKPRCIFVINIEIIDY